MEIDPKLKSSFVGLEVIISKILGTRVMPSNQGLENFKRKIHDEVRNKFENLNVVKDLPVARAYRDFYWRIGIDPTKTRPSGEALVRRILSGSGLPTINTFVDAYNLASAYTLVSIAAFDLRKISDRDLIMRKARSGEKFLGIGMKSETILRGIEIVIEDLNDGKLIAVYPYRDSEDSKVTTETTDVMLMFCGVPGLEYGTLLNSKSLTEDYVNRFCR